MQWQAHMLRGSPFGNKKNIPRPRKRNMEKCNPPVYSDSPLSIHFAVFSTHTHLLRSSVIWKESCTKDQSLGFIFNNYSLFVNSLQHLTICADGVYICKTKKNKVPCHTVADKLIVEW